MKILNKKFDENEFRVLAPFEGDDAGGGGAGTELWDDDAGDGDEGGFDDPLADGNSGAPMGAQGQEPALTPQQWVQVQRTLQQQQGGGQGQQPQQYTQEQLDKMFNVYRADEGLVERMFGDYATPQQRVEALNAMIQGVVRHVATVMQYQSQQLEQQLSGRFSPALDMVQEQKEQNFTSALTEAYPTLRGHEGVIRDVINGLKQQGYQAKDGLEAGRVVAAQVEKLLKMGNPNFQLRSQNPQYPQQRQQQSSMPRMAQQTPRGGGGASPGGGGSNRGKKPDWNVFD